MLQNLNAIINCFVSVKHNTTRKFTKETVKESAIWPGMQAHCFLSKLITSIERQSTAKLITFLAIKKHNFVYYTCCSVVDIISIQGK